MIASIPWLQSALNFFLNRILICWVCSKISEIFHLLQNELLLIAVLWLRPVFWFRVVQKNKIYFESFPTGFLSYDRRQYSGSPSWHLGVTSVIIRRYTKSLSRERVLLRIRHVRGTSVLIRTFWIRYRWLQNYVAYSFNRFPHKTRLEIYIYIYMYVCRGADKSLARPGKKQANVSVRMGWISFGVLLCR